MQKSVFLLCFAFCLFQKLAAQADSSASPASLLPLKITNFQTAVLNRNVQLQWTVSSNEEARSFEVERSDNGSTYYKIGSKLSASKTGLVNYEFVDALPKKNTAFAYRVKAIAKDGEPVYSPVQNTMVGDAALQYKLKQNPVRQAIEVEIVSTATGSLQASVFTALGQKIASETSRLSPGTNLLSLPAQNLSPGLHRLILESGNDRAVISFVKE